MNNQLVIKAIVKSNATHSQVILSNECYLSTKPTASNAVAYTEPVNPWTAPVNGDKVRFYNFNGTEVVSKWNPTLRTRFYVTNEVAKAHLNTEVAVLPAGIASL